jgi:hypothetical protein
MTWEWIAKRLRMGHWNGVQRNASHFETEKNVNTPLVTSDPLFSSSEVSKGRC